MINDFLNDFPPGGRPAEKQLIISINDFRPAGRPAEKIQNSQNLLMLQQQQQQQPAVRPAYF